MYCLISINQNGNSLIVILLNLKYTIKNSLFLHYVSLYIMSSVCRITYIYHIYFLFCQGLVFTSIKKSTSHTKFRS